MKACEILCLNMDDSDGKLLQYYRKRKELVGYPFLDWSGSIIAGLAYLSLVAGGASAFRVLSNPAGDLESGEKALYVFGSVVVGVLSFVLLKGLSSACCLLLELWRSKAQ